MTLRDIRRWLDEHVYRSTMCRPPGGWPATTLIVVAAFLVALLRLPPSQLDGMWAEDGRVFLGQALARPGIGTLAAPYNGYLHLWPRLAAMVATWFPLGHAAIVLRVAAATGVAIAAWAAWRLTEGHLQSPWLRGGLIVVTAAVPAGAFESIGNVSNTQFWLLTATTWALLARRPLARQQLAPSALVMVTALSTPLAAVLLPLSVGRLFGDRPWRERTVAVVHIAAVAIQLVMVLSTNRGGDDLGTAGDIAFGYALRVATASVLGLDRTTALVNETGRWTVWVVTAIVVVAIGAVASARRTVLPPLLLGLSLTLFAVTSLFAIGHEYPPTGDRSTALDVSARYTIVPTQLLVAAWLVAAQRLVERAPRRATIAVTAIALAPLIYTSVADYRAQPDFRAGVPAWSSEVERGRQSCRSTATDQVSLDIAPALWDIEVPCDELVD